jgi:hypothetical protein
MRSLIPVLLVVACAPDLRVDHPFDGQVSSGQLVTTQVLDGGVTLMNVDATNKNSEVFVDLDQGREMKADEAFSTNQWDLAFKRYEISMNGGAGNPTGSVKALVLDGQDFGALTRAPADGYAQDGATAVLGGWWDYDLLAHRVLTRPNLMYVVVSSEGTYFKLKMLEYYDSSGTPAAISLEYGALLPP